MQFTTIIDVKMIKKFKKQTVTLLYGLPDNFFLLNHNSAIVFLKSNIKFQALILT